MADLSKLSICGKCKGKGQYISRCRLNFDNGTIVECEQCNGLGVVIMEISHRPMTQDEYNDVETVWFDT